MPVTLTYPGVYIEEILSGIHTITGVATSITAFVGRARRGPVDEPITINSFADYERTFGGLWVDSTMSFAVRDFYLNGGKQAIIVRLYRRSIPAAAGEAQVDANGLMLKAASPGTWGNSLRARIDFDTTAPPSSTPPSNPEIFNLTVRDGGTGDVEIFRNVSVRQHHARRVDKVLTAESKLVRAISGFPSTTTPSQHAAPSGPSRDVWSENTSSDGVATVQGNDGDLLDDNSFNHEDKRARKEGLYALMRIDLFNILCIPPYRPRTEPPDRSATVPAGEPIDVGEGVLRDAAGLCEERRAVLLIDAPSHWQDKAAAVVGINGGVGTDSKNAAIFFPRISYPNPLRDNRVENFAPCGAVAGVFARTDAERGVWKAPAGLGATLVGAPALSVSLTDPENGELNPLGVNCLRAMPGAGRVVWGARTLQGDDRRTSEWKYIPVRRLALFIEESLYRGTQWVVFEPNDEPLWSQIRLNVGAFMQNLFRQGAFQGKTPREAYLVKCDRETTIQNDINLGIVNIVVGFAPLKPAEFVIIKIQQLAGQVEA